MINQNIKLGLNIIFDKDIYRAIDFASKNNFFSVEIWIAAPQFSPEKYSPKERAKVAKYSQSKNVQLQIHAFEDLSLFASHPKIRRGSLTYYKEIIDFAKDIRASVITIHPGSITIITFPQGKKVPLFYQYPKYFLQIFKENLETVGNYAIKNKAKICIENATHFEKPIMDIVEKLLRKKKLYLTWDIAKSYNKDGTIKKPELKFFLRNVKSIKNIHIHDATSIAGHEIIGKGFVDFKSFFKKVKNLDINYIIEVRPHSNALKSRDNLLRILK